MAVKKQSQRHTALEPTSPGGRRLSASQGDGSGVVFRDLVEAARCMIVILRPDATIAYFNPFAGELTGYSPAEVPGGDYFELFLPKAARAGVEEHFRRALSGRSGGDIEHPLLAKGAPIRWVVSSFRSFGEYRGKPAVLLTAQDVTVRKHTEETLQHRTHDLGERIKELNCLFGLSMLVEEPGIDLEGILQGLVDILPPGWQYPNQTCGRVVFEDAEFKTYNFRATKWKQTSPIVVYGKVVGAIEVYYLEEKPESFEGPFLAEERRLINGLAEQLGRITERRKLEKEISEISTREQRRIGQELHDSLGQELTGLGYLAETLFCDLQAHESADAETANKLARGIEHAMDQARTIAKGLVPVEIEAAGLVSAVKQLAANTEHRYGITCRVLCNEPAPVEDTATAAQLFRIVQEAVNNAAKHARAKNIVVGLKTNERQIRFEIRDDGIGIPGDLKDATGMGLRIMNYRADVIGANLTVGPADGGGTLVICSLPRVD
jgi:PAS domain S-box-containing protein